MNNNSKSQFFNTREETIKWLDKYHIKNYTINDDLSVDVKGNVNITTHNLKIIPIKFGNVTGDFWCQNNQLITLAGSPKIVGATFNCSYNQLTSLAGAPESVGESFFCNHNRLINFNGISKFIGEHFSAIKNMIINVDGLQEVYIGAFLVFEFIDKNFEDKNLLKFLQNNVDAINKKNINISLIRFYDKRYKTYRRVEINFKFLKPYLEKIALNKKFTTQNSITTKKSYL